MKIYIAGQISGLEYGEALRKFIHAEHQLRQLGHEPLNPMRLVDQSEERTYEGILLEAIEILVVSAVGIYMLHDWRESRGARIEHAIAENLGKVILYQATPLPRVHRHKEANC